MLHVTNGDSAAELIRRSSVGGDVLPWRDVLHEGPVPAQLELEQLSHLRSTFLADQGWGTVEEIRRSFIERDETFAACTEREEIVLWFEHDLYDQLQLIQLLDLVGQRAGNRPVSLICIDRFPAIERFIGLGQLDPDQIGLLFPDRRPVTSEQFELALRAWSAFRASEPTGLAGLLESDTHLLPFLTPALRRQLEQLPSTRNGLGRTEQQIVDALAAGPCTAAELFRIDQQSEPAPFLGDSIFFDYVRRLACCAQPLLTIESDPSQDGIARSTLTLTADGRSVQAATEDAIALNGIDRWWGGLHQQGNQVRWRWNGEEGRLIG